MKKQKVISAAFEIEYAPRDRKREKTKARDKARRDKKATREKFSS